MKKLLRIRGVLETVGISRSTLYALIAEGRFPKPIKIGQRSVAWVANEIDLWISKRITDSRPAIKASANEN